jgi:hypothetical protein
MRGGVLRTEHRLLELDHHALSHAVELDADLWRAPLVSIGA